MMTIVNEFDNCFMLIVVWLAIGLATRFFFALWLVAAIVAMQLYVYVVCAAFSDCVYTNVD